MRDDVLVRLKEWDRCWPGNVNIERMVDDAIEEIKTLRRAMRPAREMAECIRACGPGAPLPAQIAAAEFLGGINEGES